MAAIPIVCGPSKGGLGVSVTFFFSYFTLELYINYILNYFSNPFSQTLTVNIN